MPNEFKKETGGVFRHIGRAGYSDQESGFTLIELLIALTIFSFGLLAVASMQLSSITGNGRAKRVTESTAYAMSQMETLMSTAYTDPSLNVGSYTGASPSAGYQIGWTVANGTVTNTKVLTVKVTAPDGLVTSLVGVTAYLQ